MFGRRAGLMKVAAAMVLVPMVVVEHGFGWGEVGHHLINRLAAANLPSDVPAFLRDKAGQDAMEYLGPEPDRWRSPLEPELGAATAPDHFLDMEYSAMLPSMPTRRYDYVRAIAELAKVHPELQLTAEKAGMQPYAADESYERLKTAMRAYRQLQAAKQDTSEVERLIVVYAGLLGHYVGDASNPMHTTINYNGWAEANPKGYTTDKGTHAKFESVYVAANVTPGDVAPLVEAAKPEVIGDVWTQYMGYLTHTHSLVEQTYAMEKDGAFNEAGTPAGKAFADERLAAGAIELRNLIYTAWVRSADPLPERKAQG